MDRDRTALLARVTADAAVLGLLWIGVVAARAALDGPVPPLPADVALPIGALVVPLWLVALVPAHGGLRRHRRVVRGVVFALLAAILLLWVASVGVNRTLLLGYAAASVPALLLVRAAGDALRPRRHRVVVVGTAHDARPLVAALPQGARVVARMDPTDVDRLPALARSADEVHLAGTPDPGVLALAAKACDAAGVPLSLDANFLGLRTTRAELQELDGWTAITLRAGSDASPDRLAKRALDLVLAALLLVGLSPLLALLAVAVRRSGPAFFVQERVGRYGRPFRLYKLRTMVPDAEARLPELLARNEVRGPAFKLRDDPRVTPLGAWLRRYSLDELPQLVNVLQGHMSLVGPRPPLPAEVRAYERHQLRRLSVRPGMTGLWQVSGRADLPFERWIELDLEYVDRWSLWLDLRLLARTVPAVLAGTGAR